MSTSPTSPSAEWRPLAAQRAALACGAYELLYGGAAGGGKSDYLLVALKAYKVENNAQLGRANGVMSGQAKRFSNAELKDLLKKVRPAFIAHLDHAKNIQTSLK